MWDKVRLGREVIEVMGQGLAPAETVRGFVRFCEHSSALWGSSRGRYRPCEDRVCMICPRCDHAFSLVDSFSILNPYDFGCPHCAIRLCVGEKGEIAVRAAILIGIVLSLWAAYLSRIEHLPQGKVLGSVALVLIALAIPIQWATIRYADVQLYDRKRDYDW